MAGGHYRAGGRAEAAAGGFMSDAVRIFLRDVRIMARVGYYEQEKLAPQPVLVSLELEAAALKDYREADGDLAQVVDYGAVHAYLTQELPRLPHFWKRWRSIFWRFAGAMRG